MDKSALQGLKAVEVESLCWYFYLNIPPLLVAEIMGDVDKKTKTKSQRPELAILADKLPTHDVIISTDARRVIPGDLMGQKIPMTGQVLSEIATEYRTQSGERGLILDQTPMYSRFLQWQQGKTDSVSAEFGRMWKVATETLDASGYLAMLEREHILCPSANSPADAVASADFILAQPGNQRPLLRLFLTDIGVNAYGMIQTLARWSASPAIMLVNFAPYTAFCVRAFLLFLIFSKSGLFERRQTNRLDLEYLYYLPFCHAFCSSDAVHVALAPYLLRKDQTFFTGQELKSDIQSIARARESGELTDVVRCGPYPPLPRNEESCIFRAWRKAGIVKD